MLKEPPNQRPHRHKPSLLRARGQCSPGQQRRRKVYSTFSQLSFIFTSQISAITFTAEMRGGTTTSRAWTVECQLTCSKDADGGRGRYHADHTHYTF